MSYNSKKKPLQNPPDSHISQSNLSDQPIHEDNQAIEENQQEIEAKKKAIEDDNEIICEDNQVLKGKSELMPEKLEDINEDNEVSLEGPDLIEKKLQAIQEIDSDADEDSYEQFTVFKNNFRIHNSTLINLYWSLIFAFLFFNLYFIGSEIIPVVFGYRELSPRPMKSEAPQAYRQKSRQTLNFSEPVYPIQTLDVQEKKDPNNSLSEPSLQTQDRKQKLMKNIAALTLPTQTKDQIPTQTFVDDSKVSLAQIPEGQIPEGQISEPQIFEGQIPEEFKSNPNHQISNLNSEGIIDDMKLCFLLNAQQIEEREKYTEQKNLQVIRRLKMANRRYYYSFQDKLQVLKTIQQERLIDLELIPLLLPWATTGPLMKFDLKNFIIDILTKKYFHPGYKWLKLFQITAGRMGQWQSVGRLLGVVTFSQIPQTSRGRFSSILIFIPTVITFYVPHDLNQTQVIRFQGVRVQYDLYLDTQTVIFREELGQLSIDLTEDQRQAKQPVKRVFYCQGEYCSRFYSLVILKSKYPLRINHLKIQTISVIRNPYQ